MVDLGALRARRPGPGEPRGRRVRPDDPDRPHGRQPLRRLQRRLQDARHRPDLVALDRLAPRAAQPLPRRLRAGIDAQPLPRPAHGDRTSAWRRPMPQPFFTVDAVLDSRRASSASTPARIPEVEQASWPLATRAHRPAGPRRAGRRAAWSGCPATSTTAPAWESNPILMMQAIGSSLVRAKRALVRQADRHRRGRLRRLVQRPSSRRTRRPTSGSSTASTPPTCVEHEEALATDPEWVYRYRHHYGYHPFHAFSMIYMGGIAREHSRRSTSPAPTSPASPAGWGRAPRPPSRRRCAETAAILGRQPRVLAVPKLSRPAFHLTATGA